jgi:hypothetical protein
MQPALDILPFFLLLGFAVVGVFLATLVLIWVAVWRASRRGDAASKPPPPKPPAGEPRLPSRRRLVVLGLIGAGGGVLVGGALSRLAGQAAARSRRPGTGRIGASPVSP